MSDRDWKDRARFEHGVSHGIALAMLSSGVTEMVIDDKHGLWSYTHQMRVKKGADGRRVYSIEPQRNVSIEADRKVRRK